ncbi:unnamed protein product [Alopecurus aequalis]
MTNQQEDGASPSLPDDLVAEILAHLPAKTIGRFCCVSRSWHATLWSAPFVRLHLRQANDRPKIFFCPTECDSDEDYKFYAWQPGCAAVTKLMRDDFSRPVLLTRPLHGLVLLRCLGEGGYSVCNPSTGEVRPLPDSRKPFKMASRSFPLPLYLQVVYGFGYCSVSHEYKAVRIFSQGFAEAPPSCEVLVLNGDTPAYWRPAASQPPMCVVEEENPAVFLHGHLHFLCRDDGGILTFNVGAETFGLVPCILRGWQQWLLSLSGRPSWMAAYASLAATGTALLENKVMFCTGTRKVFTVDLYGGGVPEILLKPDEAIAGHFSDTNNYPAIGLFEESLVTLGKTTEDMVFSSPVTKAWFDVLKWLPAKSVLQLSLVCRGWRAMITTDRFIRSHAAVHTTSQRVMFVWDHIRGYDHEIDDHVIVSLAYKKKNMETRYYNLECHVRSLRGSWDLVDPPPRPVAVDMQPAYSNGRIYWVVEPKLGPSSAVWELVAFDTWDREFEVLQGPPCGDLGTSRVSILEIDDAICMACYDGDKNAIDVWMMKGDDGAWCMECRIELEKFMPEYSSQQTTLMCADPTDGRILLNTGRSLGYYDPKTTALEAIYTTGEREDDFGFCPVIVQDSLVRPFMMWTW